MLVKIVVDVCDQFYRKSDPKFINNKIDDSLSVSAINKHLINWYEANRVGENDE